MNPNLFSKLLRSFFHNPFHKLLSADNALSKRKKRKPKSNKPVQIENLEPRLVLSASTSENPLPGLRHEVVFVDSNVPNQQNLVEQIKLSESVTEVVEINASQNGLQQISSYLSGKTNLDAIHVLSHGQQGKLILGSVSIGTNEINSNLDYLATIGRSLTQDGDLLLYGCNISEGYIGQDFVNRLAEVTGADVAASDDATGNILAAGDWDLEQVAGPVETTPLVADIGNNTLANYTISIGRNDPKLYYQARSSVPSPASRFTTNYYGWEEFIGANPGPFYVKSYTADNYQWYFREVWRDQSVYYPFQGNRTVKVRGYESYSVNVGNGTRFGTQTFTVNSPSTYQIWTTRVAGSIYTDHLGEAKQLGGNNEGPYDGEFRYVTSLYQGSFDPTQPLKNLVAAHDPYSFLPQVGTPIYQGEIAYEGELQANTTYVLVVSFAYGYDDGFWYECAPSMLWGDFNVAVNDMNRPPVWDSASLNQTVSGDGVRSFSIPWSKVSDPEGDAITVSARLLVNGQEQNLPSWLTFNPNSMTFSGNAPANTGAINLRLIASDGISSVNKNFVATFTNDNDRPFVATPIPSQTWSGSGIFNYQVPLNTFSDSDPSGTNFSYSATLVNGNPLPLWLNFDAATRTFSGNPPANATDLSLRVTANDGSGQGNATFYSDFTLKLLSNNDFPTVSGFTKSFAEDNTLSFTSNDFVLADNDTYAVGGVTTTGIGKTLQAVRILSLPINGSLWLDANSDDLRVNSELVAVNQEIITGDLLKLRFTPDTNWVGSTSFTWSGTDGVSYANSPATASISVSLVNDAPVLALSGGRALSLRPNTGNPLNAVTVDPGLTLIDPDTPYTSDAATYDTIYGATVTVVDSSTGNFQSGDVLAATGISGRITVSYNSGSGSLTLSGSATAAEYQQVLRTLAFSSTNTTNDNLRTLSISLQTKDVTIPIVANFDGVDDYIETMRAAIPVAGDWTVSVWYRADTAMFSGGRDYTILAQGTRDQNFYISKNGTNNLRLGDSWTVNGGMPNDGAWHQITVVKSGTSSTNGTLYIDGIKISTGQLPNALPGTGMRIGRVYKRDNTQEWGSTYWQGSISDLRVYNRALNSLDVTDSINSNTRLTGYESNLVSWYPLDGNADNKAAGSWNLGRDFDPRSPTWLQGPWDLGFIDTGSPLSDFPSSPSGNIFRSIDTGTSDPVISGSTSLTVQTSSDIHRGKFVFVRNTVENQVSSTETIRPGEVFTLANNYSTAAQFTAPMSGIYGVDARFWSVWTNGSGNSKYRVYKLSGSTLSQVDGGGVINGNNPSDASISTLRQIVLDQGDKLIFAVSSNGGADHDERTLYLHVDLLATKVTAGSNTYFYSHSNGHYYGISSSSASWDNAKTAAEALTVGGQSGYLATPTDSASMQIMRAMIANANVSGAWAGAKQINSNNEPAGNFYWATGPKAGQPFNGSWNSGEPNNFDHGSGVREGHVEITTGNYNDNNGLLARPYVVEFGDSRLPLPGELTGTISANRDPGNAMLFKDANVAYSARSGHYYRVDSTARGWNASASAAAQTSYESQTGYLARVTSLNELRIAGWFNRLQNQADQWVGLRQTNKTSEPGGGWQWVTGDEAGMTTDESFATPTFWNAGEPNNAWSGTEDYGGMNNYGSGLNDFREVETLGSLIEYGIDGQALSIPLFGFAPNQTVSIKFVSSTALVAVRVGNTGPSASNWSASTSEDATLSFTAAQFTSSFSDPELDSLASITITALPSASAGVLKFKGVNVTLNQVVLAGELNQLAFVPIADFNGSANFSYTASDGYLSSSAATVAITVNAVNDRPVLDTAGSPVLAAIVEDISSGSNVGTTVSDIVVNGSITDVDVISPSTAPEGIAVTLVDNTNGEWQYKVASGTWASFSATRDVVSLGASALLLDGTDSIRFLPDANFNGTATFVYRAWDKSSGVAGGTSDPFAVGGNTALSVAEETATITVSAVNDAPTTTSKTISFNEDTTYVFTAADFAFADVDAGNTLQSVAITTLPTNGSVTLNNGTADGPVSQNQVISLADITGGRLKYTPPANAFGTSYGTMGFTVSDGTASSSIATITFNILDTNDAPTAIAWASGGNIAENTTSPQGVVVGTLAATDPNTGDVLSFRRTSNPNFIISPDGTVRYVSVVGLDYEITPTQTLGVTVTDSQGLTYSTNITVTVTNVSETAPTIKVNNFFAALNSLTTITSSNLCAVDEQESGASLVFTIIEQVTGGTLWVDTDGDGTVNGSENVLGNLTPSSPNVVNTFTQADIDAGKLKFRKDNTQTAGSLMVSVSDGNSLNQPTKSLMIIPSSPPVVTTIEDQQWKTSGAQFFKVPDNSFLDPDQDILSVSATKSDNSPLPNWLTFDPATWTFSGTASGVNPGDVLAIKVTATDGRNPAVSDEFNIQFVQTITAPLVSNPISTQTFQGAGSKTFVVPANTFTDPNSATITYGATQANGTSLPSWLSFDPNTRTFSGNPPASAVPGPLWLKVTGTSSGGSASSVFRLNIFDANDFPVETPAGTIPDKTLAGDVEHVFTVNRSAFSDPDGATIFLTARTNNNQELPNWLTFSFDNSTGLGTFKADLPSGTGSQIVRVFANDSLGGSGYADFTINYSGGSNAEPLVLTSNGVSGMNNLNPRGLYTISSGNLASFVVGQGTVKAITTQFLMEADPDDEGTGITFTVTTLPQNGQLWLDLDYSNTINGSESVIQVGGTFTQADIDLEKLKYRHTANNATSDSFVFTIADGGEDGSIPVVGVTFPITVAPTPSGAPTLVSVNRLNSAPQVTNADNVYFRVVFSEDVVGVDASDFALTGTAAAFGTILDIQSVSGSTYDITVGGASLAGANGTLGLALASTPSITKAGGTSINASATPLVNATYILDNNAPTVSATASVSVHDGSTPFTVTFSFNESVNGVALSDFSATNATLGNFVVVYDSNNNPTNQYRITVTPTSLQSISVSLAAGAGNDDAGNLTPSASITVLGVITITGPGGSTGSTATVSIPENTTAVYTFSADRTVTWSITGGADAARFTIDSTTGQMSFSTAPNFESPSDSNTDNVYVVVIRATDSQNATVDQTISVTVTNVNEAPTDIIVSSNSVAENQSTGTVVGNLSTTDVDTGNTFTYSLVSGSGDTDNGSFQIVNGQLQTNASFDFETKSSYSIRVRSTDQGSLIFEKAFTITVTNVNEAPTDISLSSTSVAENQSTGTVVGNLSATDVDTGSTFTYSLVSGSGDTDNGSFQIVNGQLQTNASFDFETKSSYSVRVRSTDQGNLTFEKAFTISVTDVNEAPTGVSLTNTTTSIAENTNTTTRIKVADIVVADDALGSETITLTGTDASSFEVDGSALYLKSGVSLDYETKSSYALTVNVVDALLTGSTAVTVNFTLTVTNVNEAPTDIIVSSNSVTENQSSGTVVGNLSTTDVDVGDTFTYALVSGTGDTDNGSFTLSNGQLQTNASFDFETKSSYSIRVRSTDQGNLTFEKVFTITVTNVNEAPTGVSLTNTTTSIAESTNTTTRIKVADIVVADDALGLETITLTGTDASSFEVDGLALYLKSGVSLDYETKSSYAVTLNVADISLTGSTAVTINFTLSVADVNDAPTDISLLSASVAENQPSGTVVGNLSTTDVDTGNTFTYSLVSGNGDTDNSSFTISNGQLQTNASFDFETKSSYSIRVRSTDQGGLTFDKTFTITVANVNEAPVNTVPSAQTVNEDTDLVFSLAGSNAITVADIDATNVQVALSVGNGVLTLSTITGLTFITGDGTADAAMVFSGSKSDVNTALNGLTYRGSLNFHGLDTLTIITSDLGATGTGGVMVDQDTVFITVSAVNDAPAIDLDSSVANRTQVFNGTPVGFTGSGTNLTDGDNSTFDNLKISFTTNLFVDGTNEKLYVMGASNGEIASNLGIITNRSASFVLNSTTFDYSIVVVSGVATISITGASASVLTLQQAESILDLLRYENVSNIRTSMPARVFSVSATDGGGLVSNTEALTIQITPSIPSILLGSDDTGMYNNDRVTSDNTLTFNGIGGFGDTITIFSGSTQVGSGAVSANGTFAITTTTVLSNGVHNFSAVASNTLGLSSPNSPSVTWEIRNLQVPQPIIGNNNGLPQVTGTGPLGTFVSVTIGTATYSVPVDNAGNWILNLTTAVPVSGNAPAIVSDTYQISVFASDLAGNASAPVNSSLVVTTPVQPAPVFTSNPSTSDVTPMVSGVCEPGSIITLELRTISNSLIATYQNITTASNGTWAVNLETANPQGSNSPIAPLNAGSSYLLSATATDTNLQFTSAISAQNLVIDTTAPSQPTINSGSITKDSTPVFTGTAEPRALVELVIKRGNGTASTRYQTTVDQGGAWSIDLGSVSPTTGFLNVLSDGSYIVEVVAIDAASNRSQAAVQNPYTVDTVAPLAPVITSLSLTNDNTPVIAGTAEPGSTVTVVIDGFTFTTTAISPNGAWSVDLGTAIPVGGSTPITALTDGINTVTVTATDPAGNTSAPATQNLRVDTTAPSIPQITSSDKNNDTTPVIAGLAESGSTVAVTINGSTFSTIAGPNGSWSVDLGTAIPNGGTTPFAPLVTGTSYPISVTATDVAGNTSAPATQTLAIDTSAPISPTITSPALTNQVSPTFTGMAQPGSTVTLTINGATFTTIVDANGNWTLNTATATLISGNRGTYTDGPYPVSIYSTNGFNNQSGTSTQTLTIDRTPPVIIGALASFGGNLNLDESNANAIVSVNISGIEDGQVVTVTLNSLTYTGIVYNGKVDITIPAAILSNLADGTSKTIIISTTDLAGNAATPFLVPFTVDKTGPARPSFASISSSSTDPTPGDRFTSIVNPTVVMSGQPGLTIVISGPNGVVNPSNYTVTENNGLYTIQFIINQPGGDYEVKLRDANGNYNANGNDAQNYFRIDSIPILFDNPERRSTSMGSTFGNLNIKNILNGQVFNVPQQANSTWIDLDGQTLTFGLAGGTIMQGGLLEVSNNGATLRLDTVTGAYTYTPVPMTDRTDSFLLTVQDTNGNLTQLQLSFNSLDTLDRDGVVGGSESTLAGLITGTGNASNLTGDLNRDGIADSSQNSVTTLAWRTQADFQASIDPNTAANTDRAAIVCMVVNSTIFDPNTTTTLAQLMGNVDPLAQLLQIQVTNTNGMLPDSSSFFKPWDLMNFAVESLVSTGLTDVNPDRPGTQIQVAIDISNANIPAGTFGFSMYRKHLHHNTIADYLDAGITLNDLSGNIITTPGWYDYTQRTPGGDGASFKDFNNDGKIDAIIITLTDNAFGDDNPVPNKITDPGTPGAPSVPMTTNPGGANPAVPIPPGSNPPVPAFTGFVATGNTLAAISGTSINVFPLGSTTATTSFVPFIGFQGEVRLTRADINNDGTPDIIATMGFGGLPLVRAFDGSNIANKLLEFMAYDQAFSGGIFVAIGDLGNDGILDIVTGAGNGGGPHVKIFNAITGAETSSFMAYDINFRGGISVAVGDIDGSGFAAIVTGAGPGGGPHVKVFNGTDHSLIKQFMAYASTFSGGVYVAVGDYLSDGKYEIITGAGAGGGPHIKIWDYETLNLDGQTMAFTDFTKDNGEVIDAIFNGGVRVALADANGDNVLDILAGAGPNGGPRVEAFVGFRLELLMDFFTGDKNDERGVFVSQ